jgi:hypothetical protein
MPPATRNRLPSELNGSAEKALTHECEGDVMKDKAPSVEALFSPRENPHPMEDEWETADFRKWARVPYWSAEECVALIFWKDPNDISVQDVEEVLPETAPFAQNYIAVHERILAAQRNKELPERIHPVEFFAWARQHKIYFPDELEKAVSANEVDIVQLEDRCKRLEQRVGELRRENQELRYEVDRLRAAADAAPKPEPKEVTPRERSSLLKMVIAMAMAKYGYDRIKRNTAAGDIADEIQARGMHLGDDTVREYLQEAADEELPKQQGNEESA